MKFTAEVWKPLEFPGIDPIYKISSLGRVLNIRTGKYLARQVSEKGYIMVGLYGNGKQRTKKLHRVVAYNFLGKEKFDTMTVNHKNGDKTDNTVTNLEYVTFTDNIRHSYETGLNKGLKGEDNGSSKITEALVEEVCFLYSKKLKPMEVKRYHEGNGYTYSKYIYQDIYRRKTWKHISDRYKW